MNRRSNDEAKDEDHGITGATGELNRIFGLKFIELLKECLPDITRWSSGL
jgi:hypothetical protein